MCSAYNFAWFSGSKYMKTATNTINQNKIKKLYLEGCKANSIKPKKRNYNEFVKLLEGDFSYWMKANMKFFFERMNY